MLGWLAAAAAPFLIHLWSRHRHREVPWAAMQFLLAALRKNARRIQLQQWLLLALRTLIILLVVLAVAEPYGERLLAGGGIVPRHKILVIDNSYSMEFRADADSNLERAKQLASAAVRSSGPGDVFSVICMSGQPGMVVGPRAADSAYVASRIDNIAMPYTASDLDRAMTSIDEAMRQNKDSRAPLQVPEVYVFTDLQRATWAASRPDSIAAQSRPEASAAKLKKLAQDVAVAIIDLGESSAANLAVTDFGTDEPFVTRGQPVAFHATLHQFGSEPRTQCVAEFFVDDVPVADQTVDVPAGADAVVRFTHRFESSGNHSVCVRAQGDRLPVDNSRWLVVPVRNQVRVLCVAGREGAAKYLTNALAPNSADNSLISPVVVSEGDFGGASLADFDCIFVCNVAQFTPNEAERFAGFAANGGGIVFFLGDQVIADNYNAEMTKETPSKKVGRPSAGAVFDQVGAAVPLLPARLEEIVTNPQFGLDPLDYRHPIVSVFRGQDRAGLLSTPVNRYFRLVVPPDLRDAQIAAALPNGDPFIVTAPLGRGRISVVATDASLSSIDPATKEPWTAWPTWPSFLPLVRELLAYAMSGGQGLQQQPVGAPIVGRSSTSTGKDTLRIQRPDGTTAEISIQSSSNGDEWSYSDTNVNGSYKVVGAAKDDELFAVNVDTAESDLAKIDAAELPSEITVERTWQRSNSIGVADRFGRATWNGTLLLVAIAALFVESILAWRFGRGVA
jgi:hypothetical protein